MPKKRAGKDLRSVEYGTEIAYLERLMAFIQ